MAHRGPSVARAVVMGSCKFSASFEREGLSPALMMSPLQSGRPSQQRRDKASLPRGSFQKPLLAFLFSLSLFLF